MKKIPLPACLKGWFRTDSADRRTFALDSGERQTGRSLDKIRYDHVARYEFAAAQLSASFSDEQDLFGLDIFCATGYGTRMLADRVGCRVLGVDASAEAIALADSHFSNTRTYYSTKVFPFEMPYRAFDFVICLESMEHVAETGAFLHQVVASLKAKGVLVLSTPNSRLWSLEQNPNPFHHRHFTHEEVVDMVESAEGLPLIDWYGQNLYRIEEGRIVGGLADDEMRLMRGQEGQLQIFVFQKG